MKINFKSVSFLMLIMCLAGNILVAQTKAKTDKPSAQLLELADWMTGEFNNFEQYSEDVYAKEKKGKQIKVHSHSHTIFAPINLKALGPVVFHVQQSDGHDLNRVFRMRVYVFTEDPESGKIRMDIYKYPGKRNDKSYFNLHKKPDLLKSLKAEMLKKTPCSIIWQKVGDNFVSKSMDGGCKLYSPYFKKNIVVKDDITLTKNQIWILDNIYDESGKLLMGRKDGIPRKLKKCSFYKGWAALRKSEKELKGKKNEGKYVGYFGLELHNQGQRVNLVDRSGKEAGYEVSLAQLTYGGSQTPVLKLGLHKKGEKKTKLYIWGEPDAPRLGLNVKWIQTGFTLIPGKRFSK